MEWGVRSDVGKIRSTNEDSYYLDKDNKQVFIVADGMGGHNAGEIASKMAIESISTSIKKYLENNCKTSNIFNSNVIKEAIWEANKIIHQHSLSHNGCDGMGTTLTVSVILKDHVYIGHIGDSRAYILKNNELIQLTQDHTLVSELVKNGSITEMEAKAHPKRNIITKAVGTEEIIEPDIIKYKISKDSILILCTDGLTNAITNDEIKNSFMNSNNIQETCNSLVNLANIRGGYDNITILAIRFSRSE